MAVLQGHLYERLQLDDTCEQTALIALGANLPFGEASPAETMAAALVQLAARLPGRARTSRLFRTPCFPAGAGPDYVNAAAELTLPPGAEPVDVLAILHGVEADFGRRRVQRWGMRTLDIDLLSFG